MKSLIAEKTSLLGVVLLVSTLGLVGCGNDSSGGGSFSADGATEEEDAGAAEIDTSTLPVDPDLARDDPVAGDFSLAFTCLDENFDWPTRGIHLNECTVVATLTDRASHAVPDGAVVTFSVESGLIEKTCTIKNSSCEVQWLSTVADQPADGLVTILATVRATENFDDTKGNVHGMFDDADGHVADGYDIGDLYRDDYALNSAEANTFNQARADAAIVWVDGNGPTDGVLEAAGDGLYNGPVCDPAATLCAVNNGGDAYITLWRASVLQIVYPQ